MPSTIEQTKEAILRQGKASKHEIARELKISLDYVGLILGDLKRKGEVVFSGGFYILASAQLKKPITPPPAKQSVRRSRKSKGTKKARKPKVEKNTASHWHGL